MVRKKEPKGKPAAKRQIKSKGKTKKPLTKAPEECIFWCIDGHTFRDLKELAEGLTAMSNETFYHHVTRDRNDFTNWVRDVINDVELANDLTKATCRDEAATYVVARLDYYE
jgi:hypothetical protein